MGGDNAPSAVVQGAVAALREDGSEIILVGQEQRIEEELKRWGKPAGLTAVPAEEVIAPEEPPVAAIRHKKNSSMAVGLNLVKRGVGDAFVSAGSTGALMAGSLFLLGRIAGIDRPALGALFPTGSGRGYLLLDGGANTSLRPENLLQYAFMGSLYVEQVLGVSRPRIGLLNVGTEENKGNDLTRAAYRLLAKSDLNFTGNIEARDLPEGKVDVVVCDGFVGNVVVKLMEGTLVTLFSLLKEEVGRTWLDRLGAVLLMPAFRRLKKRIDYAEYGGAPFLGVDGVAIKCHGSSDYRAIKNGIRVARELVRTEIVDKIKQGITQVGVGE
ncbi:MAG: phosphate acyltransferase PlsX [Firmicutes bacterium]|nr:phosphate acyltransferase PlsX [Bacillota bacterium]MCL5038324.1 phosphate acyltransferase PlsX [Bacillota bacterium]